MRLLLFLLILPLLVTACAKHKLELPSETVTDSTYNAMSCEEIIADRDRLQKLFDTEEQYLPAQGGLGARYRDLRFSILKIFNSKADENYQRRLQRYDRIRGQYESAQRVAERRCGEPAQE